ncbi:GNAT family N-acetyltransferase [Actinokineospora diospyrosa]|uniref:Ribosomal protein S18 acetylase RimI n=1 Tax=Actinokineospora diospyrosa TaxID=103728 RepID=A0ABT1I6V0_9PSEU|nr:GNAT family N-acetyltransferase [Actinokineospora diospyrosa]MCP2268358.1 Ribosomal protein S18 acetylase RimI [Actinokineospora diospyrosa]
MTDYTIRPATPTDLPGARSVMLDTLYRDLGYGYNPPWHEDVIDPGTVYLDNPRHALFVAVLGDEVVATTGVRAVAPLSPPHPDWLVARYPRDQTAQLFRVYVRENHRRHGLARRLVGEAVRFVAGVGGYEVLYLHTDARVAGAEAFWNSVAKQVHDARDGDLERFQTVHYEIPF